MNVKAEENGSPLDTIKWLVSLVVLVAGIGGYYYFEAESAAIRIVGLLVAVGIAVAVAYMTQQGKALWSFAQESRQEVRKVVWPTKQETVQTTIIVLVMVTLVGIALWLIDMFFAWGYTVITGQGA